MALADVAPDLAEQCARLYRDFARIEAAGVSPLYERLARAAADDPLALGLLASAQGTQRRPNLVFAAIHDVVLEHGLTFPSTAADLHTLLVRWQKGVAEVVATRTIQTNEVGRCAPFLVAFSAVHRASNRPLALLEVGASAGLNLHFDDYRYQYRGSHRWLVGPRTAGLSIVSHLRGSAELPRPAMPPVSGRIGLDISPLDPRNVGDARWLEALVWADQSERLARIRASIEVARQQPVTVIPGDAVDQLNAAAARLPTAAELVVFHSAVLTYLEADRRAEFVDTLEILARSRPVTWVPMEAEALVPDWQPAPGPRPTTAHSVLRIGRGKDLRVAPPVARSGMHGEWIEWL